MQVFLVEFFPYSSNTAVLHVCMYGASPCDGDRGMVSHGRSSLRRGAGHQHLSWCLSHSSSPSPSFPPASLLWYPAITQLAIVCPRHHRLRRGGRRTARTDWVVRQTHGTLSPVSRALISETSNLEGYGVVCLSSSHAHAYGTQSQRALHVQHAVTGICSNARLQLMYK